MMWCLLPFLFVPCFVLLRIMLLDAHRRLKNSEEKTLISYRYVFLPVTTENLRHRVQKQQRVVIQYVALFGSKSEYYYE
jgi:hypothetical protein